MNGITANRCKHLLTTPHKEWQIPEDEEGNSMLEHVENLDETLVPDKALDNEETRRMILGLVDDLPPEQRMSVLFYYYDEMSVKQIAEAMDTSEGTVKSRLNYARKSIKAGVEEYERKASSSTASARSCCWRTSCGRRLPVPFWTPRRRPPWRGRCCPRRAARPERQGAAAESAAGTAAESAAGTSSAVTAGTSSAGGGASGAAAAGAAVKAGISTKLIAAVVAGAIVVGGGAVGLSALTDRGGQETPTAEVVESPEAEPDGSFAQAHGFVIVEPQAFDDLPLDLVFGGPGPGGAAVHLRRHPAGHLRHGPDAEGYVTYTVSYTITAQSRLGDATGSAALSCSILAQDYNLYDYYTGQLYLPDNGETTASGEVRTTGSAVIQHDGTEVELTYGKNWSSGMYPGSWTESTQPDLAREIVIDSDMTSTIVVRVPADYDGILLGINVTDPPTRTRS